MEIRGHQSPAVIDVHDVAGEKEIVDQGDDPAIGGAYGLPYRSAEIDTQVTTRHPAIEQTPRPELAGDC
jgi:hypothetical protein